MLLGEPVGVARRKILHSSREVGLWRAQEEMDVVGHQDVTEELPTEPVDRRLQSVDQALVVGILVKDPLRALPRHMT